VVNAAGQAEQRQLTIERAVGNDWLISSGLNAGDRVIVEGALKVKPGIPVKAVPFDPLGKNNNPAASAGNKRGGR
jgi:membrane fusion protein (multidrug efflux system)